MTARAKTGRMPGRMPGGRPGLRPGMSFGQLLTLTFGFLLASVMIFVLGLWVGRFLAEQKQANPRPVVRQSVESGIPAADRVFDPLPTKTAPIVFAPPSDRPTRPRAAPTASRTRMQSPTATSQRRSSATPVVRPTRPAKPTARSARHPAQPAVTGAVWTVQVTATNDAVQAAVVRRGLRTKGFDAFIAQAEVAGTTWYRIQVGQFADKKQAQQAVDKLRQQGMEAAFVDRMR